MNGMICVLFAVCKGCIIYAKKSHLVCKIRNKTIVVLKLFLAHSIYKNHLKIVDTSKDGFLRHLCGSDSPDHFARSSTQIYKYMISLCIYVYLCSSNDGSTYLTNTYIFERRDFQIFLASRIHYSDRKESLEFRIKSSKHSLSLQPAIQSQTT